MAISKCNTLHSFGIKKKFRLGVNKYGYADVVLVLQDRTVWDLIPEYNIYEQRDGWLWNESMTANELKLTLQ
jgi:hypothetical protein